VGKCVSDIYDDFQVPERTPDKIEESALHNRKLALKAYSEVN
jgi:hypothetical protein